MKRHGVFDEHQILKKFTNVSEKLNRRQYFKMFVDDNYLAKIPLGWKKSVGYGIIIPQRMGNCKKCSEDIIREGCDKVVSQKKNSQLI